jgi:hypothetical protein
MNIITQNFENEKTVAQTIINFLKKYRITNLLRNSGAYKSRGIGVAEVFKYLFALVFTNRSMYMNMIMGTFKAEFAKDTVYRFINSIHINWIRFTTLLASQISNETITNLTGNDRVNVLIVDDTMHTRAGAKKVELLSKIYDHAKKKFNYGFRLLTLGWSDGNTFLPVNGCLLSTENMKNRVCDAKDIDKHTVGYKRRILAQTKAPSVVLSLIEEAKNARIPAQYVLFDTWFCSPSSLIAVHKLGYDVIAMAKKSSKVYYKFDGSLMPLTEIFRISKKRPGRARYLLSVDVSVEKDGITLPARIIYVRNRSNRKDYLAIITTDMTTDENEIIRIYGKRWDIEVFFKVCKSYLKLGGECRSLSYDAMTAHVAVVFTRYMMLSVQKRINSDDRSLGEFFYHFTDEMADISWLYAINLLMRTFLNTVSDKFSLTDKALNELFDAFLSALPLNLRVLFRVSA